MLFLLVCLHHKCCFLSFFLSWIIPNWPTARKSFLKHRSDHDLLLFKNPSIITSHFHYKSLASRVFNELPLPLSWLSPVGLDLSDSMWASKWLFICHPLFLECSCFSFFPWLTSVHTLALKNRYCFQGYSLHIYVFVA